MKFSKQGKFANLQRSTHLFGKQIKQIKLKIFKTIIPTFIVFSILQEVL